MVVVVQAGDPATRPIDLAAVGTPEALAAALDNLRRQRGIGSKRALSTLAERKGWVLPKSTVDDMLSGRRVPTDHTLRIYLAVCGIAADPTADEPAVQDWLRAAERARLGDADRPAGAVRVQDANPRTLGVHAAIQVPDASGDLPAYVLRDLDQDTNTAGLRGKLRNAAAHGGMVLLVGGSSVGKTRAAFEALRAVLPNWWLLQPDSDRPDDLAALAQHPPAHTVVWLDELQSYMDRDQGLTAGTIRALLHADTPVVVVGTLWPHWHTTWTTPPTPEKADPYQRHRDLLGLAEVVHVSAVFSPAEHDRATHLAKDDRRLAAALATRGYGLTQTLAAAPQLIARWQDADPYARAVLCAAIDAVRLGVRNPLPPGLLRAAAPGYCTAAEQAAAEPNWFEVAIAYATQRLHGAVAPLTPVSRPGGGMGEAAGYLVADYLLQHVGAQRRTVRVPAALWNALLDHVHNVDDVRRLAESADGRLLYGYAELLWRRVIDDNPNDPQATERVIGLLEAQGRVEEVLAVLRTQANAGDWWATRRLVDRLAEQGRVEEVLAVLRTHADAGDRSSAGLAAERLAKLLAEQGREEELEARADAGDGEATVQLVGLLEAQGRIEEALAILRTRADARDGQTAGRAALRLAKLLAEQGSEGELRVRADAGDTSATEGLVDLLEEQGRAEDALAVLRARANAGDRWATAQLVDRLTQQGRVQETLAVLRARTEAGDGQAAERLVHLLLKQGRMQEALPILRARADAGDWQATERLVTLLKAQGQVEQALPILRARADAGDWQATERLIELLKAQGQVEQALAVLRARADAGDRWATRELVGQLAEQGREEELHARADAGDREAAIHLVGLLKAQGQVEDALAFLRTRADAGDWRVAGPLATLLTEQGREEELRARADAGDMSAAAHLVSRLAKQGRMEEALAVLRARADAGDWIATRQLVDLLAEQGRERELQDEVYAGTPGAAMHLISLLEKRGKAKQADCMRRFGLNPDGSLAEAPSRGCGPRQR